MICKVVYVLLILTAAPSSSLAVIPIIGNGLILAVLFSFYIAYTPTPPLYTHHDQNLEHEGQRGRSREEETKDQRCSNPCTERYLQSTGSRSAP